MLNAQHLKQVSYNSPLFGNIFKAYPFSSPNSTKYLVIPNAQANSKLSNPQANKFICPSLSNDNNACCYIVLQGQCLGKHLSTHRNYDERPTFTQEQIWILIQSMCSAFALLSQEGCSHKLTHLKQYSIRMLGEDRGFKLIYHQKIIPQLKCAQSNLIKWNQLFLSPEQLQNEFVPQKSVVFSFGVILLNICSLLDAGRSIYQLNSFKVDYNIVKQKIIIAGSMYGYSKLLTNFIQGCLVQQHERRLGFVELKQFFQRKKRRIFERSSELLSQIALIQKNNGNNGVSYEVKFPKEQDKNLEFSKSNYQTRSAQNLQSQNVQKDQIASKDLLKSEAQKGKQSSNHKPKKKSLKLEAPRNKIQRKTQINQITQNIDYRGTFGDKYLAPNHDESLIVKNHNTLKKSKKKLSDEESEADEQQKTNKQSKLQKFPEIVDVSKNLLGKYSASEITNAHSNQHQEVYETNSNPLKFQITCHNGYHEVKQHECLNHSEQIDTPKGFGKFQFQNLGNIEESNSEINEQYFEFHNPDGEIPELITKMEKLDLKFCLKPVQELKNSIGKIGVWVEGDLYFGDFINGRRNGLALQIFSNGEYYYGYFKQDLFEGEGLLFWNEEEYFFGIFQLGQKFQGRLQGEVKYQGGFKNNKRHGHGTCWYSSGQIYIGEWLNGKRNGTGKVVQIDGSIFVGLWVKGKKRGEGYLENDMMKIGGYWVDEQIEGETLIEYTNGDVFHGKTGSNLQKVSGQYVSKSGKIFKGDFKGDQPSVGELIYSNKDRYVGHLRNMKRHGYGEYYYSSGDVYKGEWENNNKKQ